jgi:alpha-N-acetylglucosamine transferase
LDLSSPKSNIEFGALRIPSENFWNWSLSPFFKVSPIARKMVLCSLSSLSQTVSQKNILIFACVLINLMRNGHKTMAPWLSSKTISTIFFINLVGFLLFFTYITFQTDTTPQPSFDSNNAYITFTNNDAYAKGVVALAMSLNEVGSAYPLVAMVTKEVSPTITNLLESVGCIVYKTDLIELPPELSLQTERWGPAFTKLVSWKKTEFSKLMFLDSDLLVLQNIDYLFEQSGTLLATVDADASSCLYVLRSSPPFFLLR